MPRKIIIEVVDGLPLAEAMGLVGQVIAAGRTSKTGQRKQFCFCTTFKTGVQVWAKPKRSASTDSFRVEKTPERLDREN